MLQTRQPRILQLWGSGLCWGALTAFDGALYNCGQQRKLRLLLGQREELQHPHALALQPWHMRKGIQVTNAHVAGCASP